MQLKMAFKKNENNKNWASRQKTKNHQNATVSVGNHKSKEEKPLNKEKAETILKQPLKATQQLSESLPGTVKQNAMFKNAPSNQTDS